MLNFYEMSKFSVNNNNPLDRFCKSVRHITSGSQIPYSQKASFLRGSCIILFCHICVRSCLPVVFPFIEETPDTVSPIKQDWDNHIIRPLDVILKQPAEWDMLYRCITIVCIYLRLLETVQNPLKLGLNSLNILRIAFTTFVLEKPY